MTLIRVGWRLQIAAQRQFSETKLPVWSDPNQCKSALVRRLHAWWLERTFDSDVPDRCALHPEDIKPLLPCLFVADAEHDPFRVRYRLVGTRAAEVTGMDITGRY